MVIIEKFEELLATYREDNSDISTLTWIWFKRKEMYNDILDRPFAVTMKSVLLLPKLVKPKRVESS